MRRVSVADNNGAVHQLGDYGPGCMAKGAGDHCLKLRFWHTLACHLDVDASLEHRRSVWVAAVMSPIRAPAIVQPVERNKLSLLR